MNRSKSERLWSLLLVGFAALAILYIGYQVYRVVHEPVRTAVARQATVDDTVAADTFVVRNESYLSTTSDGTLIPEIASGSRVAAGEGVVAIFDQEKEAAGYAELSDVKENLNRYNRLNKQKNSYAVNLSAMSRNIANQIIDLAATVDSGDLTGLQSQIYDVRDELITKQIATGEKVNLDNKITELESRHSALSNKTVGYDSLVSEVSGYYIDSADGFEQAVDYDKVLELTPADIRKLLKADPDKVDKDVIGKVSSDFDWYLLTVLDSDKAKNLKPGSRVTVNLPYSAVNSVEADVASKSKATKKGDVAVVLKCNRMNSYIASLRKERAEIVMHSYTGLKIPTEAVVVSEDGEKGVYVLEGNIAKFKKLRTVYTEDDFLISSETVKDGEKGSYVKLYDSVILGGKDLYDGKILN